MVIAITHPGGGLMDDEPPQRPDAKRGRLCTPTVLSCHWLPAEGEDYWTMQDHLGFRGACLTCGWVGPPRRDARAENSRSRTPTTTATRAGGRSPCCPRRRAWRRQPPTGSSSPAGMSGGGTFCPKAGWTVAVRSGPRARRPPVATWPAVPLVAAMTWLPLIPFGRPQGASCACCDRGSSGLEGRDRSASWRPLLPPPPLPALKCEVRGGIGVALERRPAPWTGGR